jgi:glycosyltransferase involved in cell wall biosynthesis
VKFSVILITHNNADHVGKALGSIRAQTTPDWECLVVDNGSTDDTLAVAKAAHPDDSRFRFYAKSNEGPSAGRNYGYRLLSKDSAYVAFIDGDDWIRENFLEYLGGYLDDHPAAGMAVCQFDKADSTGEPMGPGRRSRYARNSLGFPHLMTDDEIVTPFVAFFSVTGQGPFALFRRSTYDRTTGYEESFFSHEDSDIFCQMALQAEIHSVAVSLYVKRTHSANLTGVGNTNPFAQTCYDKFREKWDRLHIDDARKQKTLIAARKYYYTRHLPLRNFKNLSVATKEFLQKPSYEQLTWIWYLISHSLYDTFFGYRKSKGKNSTAA